MSNYKWNALCVSVRKLGERMGRLKTFDMLMSEVEDGVWLLVFSDWAPWEKIVNLLEAYSYREMDNNAADNGYIKRHFNIGLETLVEKLSECNISCFEKEKEFYSTKVNVARLQRIKIVEKFINDDLSVEEAVPPELAGLVRPRDVDHWVNEFRTKGLIVNDNVYGPKFLPPEP